MTVDKRPAFSRPSPKDPDEAMLASSAPAGRIYKPWAADTSIIPGKIKIDLSTAL